MLFFWWVVYATVFWLLVSIASITGTILSITIPALYNRYQDHVDRFAGLIHRQMSHHYKIVDENVISRIPRSLSKYKDSWTFRMQLNYMSADHFFCGFKLFLSLKLHGLFSRFFISSYVPVFISALDSLSRKQAGILKSESPDSFVYLRA